MAIRSSAVKRSRGGQRKVYARADATLLVEHKFHPIEDMIITAKGLEGMERINAADKIARYFYPTRKAIEVEGMLDTDVRIILGGIDN
jgi:hypothetical protein